MSIIRKNNSCSTEVCRGLDEQILYLMLEDEPNVLVDITGMNVSVGKPVWPLLQPNAARALERALGERGRVMVINSAYRTIAQQAILYSHSRAKRCGIKIAAKPGQSNHQSGLALDVDDAAGWQMFMSRAGFKRLMPHDPVHFDYQGSGVDLRNASARAFQRLWNLNNHKKLVEDGDLGDETLRALLNSPMEGFPIGERYRIKQKTYVIGSRLLKYQHPIMEGEDVRKIQERLNFFGAEIEVDGYFGVVTEGAVRAFQKRQGLEEDGVVGPKVLKKLMG